MDADKEFIERLSVLGLNEKEAQLYYYLLKYGGKTPSRAAKYLKTYREDINRTLSALVDKGLITMSLDKPTTYTAVPIDIALEAIHQQRAYEQKKIQETENALLALSNDLGTDIPDDVDNFKMHKTIRESLAAGEQLIRRAQQSIVVIPPPSLNIAGHYGVFDAYGEARRRGVNMRAIVNVTRDVLGNVQELIENGVAVRHYPDYEGMRLFVMDGRESLTAINVDIRRHSLDEMATSFWCDSPTYAQHLTHIFEILWEQATDAADQIEELSRASQ
ncbi:MAG: TrmB family transcriptional regulator [Halobacteriota archaeon]